MIIETSGLSKHYGDFVALRDCNLQVPRGETFGLLGPNGAGKTTLIRSLLGFLKPTAGKAEVAGFDCTHEPVEVRRRVAYMPGETRLFRTMRGKELLRFFAEIRDRRSFSKSLELAQRLDLDVSRRVSMMSTGMRQKLALAATLASSAEVVILDEPTSNLDPTVRRTVLALVAEAKEAGKTLMFSSHVLSEAEEVCDRVAIMRAGQLVHMQPMNQLREQHQIFGTAPGGLPSLPAEIDAELTQTGDSVTINANSDLKPVLSWLSTTDLVGVRVAPVGLRAVYDQFHTSEEVAKQ